MRTAHYGPQVITRYATRGFSTDSTWYTDSQGQEMQKRRYNYRPTWPLNVTEPVAGNYYPMNSAAFLRSGDAQITYDCSCPNLRLRLNGRLSLVCDFLFWSIGSSTIAARLVAALPTVSLRYSSPQLNHRLGANNYE